MTQLVVGDIHGCWDELQELLERSGIGDNDEIIALGDLVDRGPKPSEVLRFFQRAANARSIRGNHEEFHLQCQNHRIIPGATQFVTRWYLNDAYRDFLEYAETLPPYLELPDALLVHGFFEPGIVLENQDASVLLGMTEGEQYLGQTYQQPWYTYFHAEKPIIVGHRDYGTFNQPFIYNETVFAIDTRCVYGGALTGVILPDFKIISVPARDDYWKTIRKRHNLLTP